MHLKDDTLEKKLDNGLTIRTAFSVKPGTYVVRLVVRDSEGQDIRRKIAPLIYRSAGRLALVRKIGEPAGKTAGCVQGM